MNGFIDLMNTAGGRLGRIVVGGALMLWGFGFSGLTPLGVVAGVIGIVPLVMGAWGRCLPELFLRRQPSVS